jgi:hypothetical protein
MPVEPFIGAMLGGWEIILILAVLFILGGGAVGVAALIYILIRSGQSKSTTPPGSSLPPVPRPDVEQELRSLVKLKQDGVVTEEEFNAKKKALLGL